ncbi:MAG: formate acetyltransferase, partial [Bacteroidales bacterium]|nr:formate acetyltransferase [Bacteroidales bacterium]
MRQEWNDFNPGSWTSDINVRSFIQHNYTPYEGDESFLAGPSKRTTELWEEVLELMKVETKNGIVDAETHKPSTITAFGPGYLDKEKEIIVGFQTDKPLKRGIMPNGGIRVVKNALEAYGYTLDKTTEEIYTNNRKTHNDGVFDAYTDAMRKARHTGIITGLPDAYGRGRIIGDYRRVALYGVDWLIKEKQHQKVLLERSSLESPDIRLREEISEQIGALKQLKDMATTYGFDISVPAKNSLEATQWTYFAYLGSIKEQDGAAMSLGRVSTFLDIYYERDLKNGVITETEIQEIIDQFVMKRRMVRFLRTPSYNDLFSGDPTWVTES